MAESDSTDLPQDMTMGEVEILSCIFPKNTLPMESYVPIDTVRRKIVPLFDSERRGSVK